MGARKIFSRDWQTRMVDKIIRGLRLVGWCLTALSAQKGYIVPWEKLKFVKDINFKQEVKINCLGY